jgi:hypothetical protein
MGSPHPPCRWRARNHSGHARLRGFPPLGPPTADVNRPKASSLGLDSTSESDPDHAPRPLGTAHRASPFPLGRWQTGDPPPMTRDSGRHPGAFAPPRSSRFGRAQPTRPKGPAWMPLGDLAGRSHELSFPYSARGTGEPMRTSMPARPDAPSGFLNLSTLYSPPNRPGLFHPGGAHGVVLPRGFPPTTADPLSGGPAPPDVRRRSAPPSGV